MYRAIFCNANLYSDRKMKLNCMTACKNETKRRLQHDLQRYQKETPTVVFSCEVSENFKEQFFL